MSAPNNVKGYTYYNIALCYEKIADMADNMNQKQKIIIAKSNVIKVNL